MGYQFLTIDAIQAGTDSNQKGIQTEYESVFMLLKNKPYHTDKLQHCQYQINLLDLLLTHHLLNLTVLLPKKRTPFSKKQQKRNGKYRRN